MGYSPWGRKGWDTTEHVHTVSRSGLPLVLSIGPQVSEEEGKSWWGS